MSDNYSFLVWAYNIVWIGLAAYIVWMSMRIRKVSGRLSRLERQAGLGESDSERDDP